MPSRALDWSIIKNILHILYVKERKSGSLLFKSINYLLSMLKQNREKDLKFHSEPNQIETYLNHGSPTCVINIQDFNIDIYLCF
jgi:hypothetical protein